MSEVRLSAQQRFLLHTVQKYIENVGPERERKRERERERERGESANGLQTLPAYRAHKPHTFSQVDIVAESRSLQVQDLSVQQELRSWER